MLGGIPHGVWAATSARGPASLEYRNGELVDFQQFECGTRLIILHVNANDQSFDREDNQTKPKRQCFPWYLKCKFAVHQIHTASTQGAPNS